MTRAAAGADCAPGHGLGGDLAADEGNGSRASRCPPALACCAAANLAHEQLVNTDKRERRPRRDHPPGRSWLGDGNVGSQARRAARDQQRPGQHPAALPLARVGQQRGRRGHDQPIHRQRRQRSHPPRLAVQPDQRVHMEVGHRPGDQRQQAHAPGRRPPDPPVPPARSRPASNCELADEHALGFGCNLGHVISPRAAVGGRARASPVPGLGRRGCLAPGRPPSRLLVPVGYQ
jgi:hypothetical protein